METSKKISRLIADARMNGYLIDEVVGLRDYESKIMDLTGRTIETFDGSISKNYVKIKTIIRVKANFTSLEEHDILYNECTNVCITGSGKYYNANNGGSWICKTEEVPRHATLFSTVPIAEECCKEIFAKCGIKELRIVKLVKDKNNPYFSTVTIRTVYRDGRSLIRTGEPYCASIKM